MHPSSETLGQSEGVRERQNNEKKLSLRPLAAPESLRMDEYKMVDESLEKKAILVLKITRVLIQELFYRPALIMVAETLPGKSRA